MSLFCNQGLEGLRSQIQTILGGDGDGNGDADGYSKNTNVGCDGGLNTKGGDANEECWCR